MSSYDLAEVWVKFLEKFHESTSENVYNAWIKPLIPLEITDMVMHRDVRTGWIGARVVFACASMPICWR